MNEIITNAFSLNDDDDDDDDDDDFLSLLENAANKFSSIYAIA